jgi:hypothetical protein
MSQARTALGTPYVWLGPQRIRRIVGGHYLLTLPTDELAFKGRKRTLSGRRFSVESNWLLQEPTLDLIGIELHSGRLVNYPGPKLIRLAYLWLHTHRISSENDQPYTTSGIAHILLLVLSRACTSSIINNIK